MVQLALVAAASLAVQPQQPVRPAESAVAVRVLDSQGRPVPNVLVGTQAMTTEQPAQTQLMLFGQARADAAETNDSGLASLAPNEIFYGDGDAEPKSIIAWTKDHTLVGLAQVQRPCPAAPVEVQLRPACRVEIKVTSDGLEKLGKPLSWSLVYVNWHNLRAMSSESRVGRQLFFLPAGEYELSVYGADADSVYQPLKIEPSEQLKQLTIDLPACRIAQLAGKPAPEFASIQGWLNGGPVKLADLKGKVVLLDFWGYWCGPCVYGMPELVAMHERYKDQGLVIVAVHDASVRTIADMQTKLERTRNEVWKGKDLPFLVALDGGRSPGPGGKLHGSGDTTAAYGITTFPTQVLIDRDGNVVGRPRKGQIEEMLKAPPAR